MRLNRIYVPGPLASGKTVDMPTSGANHVARVLRLREGDSISIFDGEGHEFRATLATVNARKVIVKVGEAATPATESPVRITLAQGVSRGERMDWVVQKAVELGVAGLVPVVTARSVVKLDREQAKKKQEHWSSIAIGACEQSGRAYVPPIATPITLLQHLSDSGSGDTPRFRLVLDPTASQSLNAMETKNGECPHFELLVGPEGGLDDDELDAAHRAGFVSVKLGPRVLRTETAAVAALAVLQARWGDLR